MSRNTFPEPQPDSASYVDLQLEEMGNKTVLLFWPLKTKTKIGFLLVLKSRRSQNFPSLSII